MSTPFRTIENIASVYSAATFERRARKLGYTPRTWALFALLGVAIASMLFAGGLGFFAVAAKQLYLNAYGVETPARVTDVTYRTYTYHKTKWETINYEFTTLQGETIKAQLDRPVRELAALPDRNHLRIVYWDWLPSVNSPRRVQLNAAIFLAPMFLLFTTHFALWSKRMIDWRRTLLRTQPETNN